MDVQERLVTPADASKLLERNSINRLLSPTRVNSLVAAIDRNGWLADANPIKIDEDDVLLDGQHRLHAIVKSGKPVTCLVATGVPSLSRLVVDTNRPRSFADFLRLNAVRSAGDAASVTRLLWSYDEGALERRWFTADTATLWGFYKINAELITESVGRGKSTYRYVQNIPRSVMAVAWAIFSRIDIDDAALFWAELRGEEKAGKAASILCTFGVTNASRGRFDQRYNLAIVIKAWNAFRRHADISVIQWKVAGGEKFPEPK